MNVDCSVLTIEHGSWDYGNGVIMTEGLWYS